MIDEFLDMLKYDFAQKVWPKLTIEGDIIKTLPQGYDLRF
jgi:hypothetical protein